MCLASLNSVSYPNYTTLSFVFDHHNHLYLCLCFTYTVMASEGDEVPALWKVNRTMHEMIKDRGYAVSDDEINMSLDAFRASYASQTGSIECVEATPLLFGALLTVRQPLTTQLLHEHA